ncbi:MAG: HAMP domain-containing histidine kinase [Anaerolineae bacterium]|nr:HAMP domain-containing histidine kinase [Anaerolineae bacterium]
MTIYSDPKAEWLNTVAHDLKTPINSVRGCIELIQQMGPLNDKQQHYADRAMAGLQRMEHLVARLLDISWIDAGMQLDLNDINLYTLIHEVVDLLRETAERRSITIHVNVDDRVGTVRADNRRLMQVLDNLLSNAIKYNNDNGVVTITVVRDSDSVKVTVQDTGMGISPEDQPHVFERFFRARQSVAMRIEGSGLGLAITKGIIQKHRGRIWMQSSPGEGSVFFFTLPVQTGMSEGRDRQVESPQYPGEEGRDGRMRHHVGLASEEPDVVNDNIQENRDETPHIDSTGDEL